MKELQKGCSCTEPWVSPSDWRTTTAKSSLKKNWYIQCNFYDPIFAKDYPKGFPFRKKLNKLKTLDARKAAAELYLKEIPVLFEQKGYNPITRTYMIEQVAEPILDEARPELEEIMPETPFLVALELARKNMKIAKSTNQDIEYMLARINKASVELRFDELKISDVKRKNIRLILERLEKTEKTFSSHKFNKYRGYLSIIYNELVEFEAVEANIIDGIKKRIHEKKIREILSEAERTKVDDHLKNNHVSFWIFTNVFFHSGGRITELLDLKTEDVNLASQKYRTLIKKGRRYVWVEKVIKDIAIPFWIKSLYNAQKGDYIFSRGLVPGTERIRREQIDRRWRVHVKQKLGITADFYGLKHLNLDETAEILSLKDAAKMASHTSTKMLEKHYAVGEEGRQLERLKTIDNPFSKAG